jgi:hypothetical protein
LAPSTRIDENPKADPFVIDVQEGFEDAINWGRRDNPACEGNICRAIGSLADQLLACCVCPAQFSRENDL